MNNHYFIWNGIRSNNDEDPDTLGVVMLTPPTRITPIERTSFVDIPGRAGSLTLLEGDDVYNDITLACTVIIKDASKIDAICAWLKGSGEVTFGNMPNGYYKARITNQISFDQIVRGDPHRSFQVQFRCKPFFYLHSGLETITVDEGMTITNPGNIASEPLIQVFGTDEGTVMIGSNTMLINSFDDGGYIMLDCEAKIAYAGARGDPNDPFRLLGTRVTGEWIKIPYGDTVVSISGGITSIIITPRWRCK